MKELLRKIIQNEIKLTRQGSFYFFEKHWFKIKIVVFEDPKTLGFLRTSDYTIGLNKTLMYTAKTEVIENILRHEFCHLLHFFKDPTEFAISPHGASYRDLCQSLGYGPDVYDASVEISQANINIQSHEDIERMLDKIKKLMELSRSSNKHEAELATLKANQLLMRYQLDLNEKYSFSTINDDQEFCLVRILPFKRKNAKICAIINIIETFQLYPVFTGNPDDSGFFYVEIMGSRLAIEWGQYLSDYLNRELDRLWEEEKKILGSGLRQKNSFFDGLAYGFVQKQKTVKKSFSSKDNQTLVVLEKKLDDAVHSFYPNLRSSSRSSIRDAQAFMNGSQRGQSMQINRPLNSSSQTTHYLE